MTDSYYYRLCGTELATWLRVFIYFMFLSIDWLLILIDCSDKINSKFLLDLDWQWCSSFAADMGFFFDPLWSKYPQSCTSIAEETVKRGIFVIQGKH